MLSQSSGMNRRSELDLVKLKLKDFRPANTVENSTVWHDHPKFISVQSNVYRAYRPISIFCE